MCGRYILAADREAFIRFYGFDPVDEVSETRIDPFKGLDLFEPRYNIAPSEPVPMIRARAHPDREIIRQGPGGERQLVMARWGLMSRGGDKRGGYPIARGETVATSPAFRDAFRYRRCILPTSGFYEWQGDRPPKQPWLIEHVDGDPMGFAGLWETWHDPKTGEAVTCCSIITTTANETMAPIHDRMPVILDPTDHELWLSGGEEDLPKLQALLRPCPAGWIKATKVSRKVNNARYKSRDVIEPVDDGLLL